MNEQDLNAFKDWWDDGVAKPVSVGYDCATEAWQACCGYKDKQYQTLYDNARVTIQQEQDRCREQLTAKDAVIAKLREYLSHIQFATKPGPDDGSGHENAYMLAQLALALPNDYSVLREYAENWLNKSPEMALLNQIGDLLEPIEYQGSYVDGIQALVKQAKREGQAEMREGWKLVPIEPTPAMLEAGNAIGYMSINSGKKPNLIDYFEAMLAAAPEYKGT